MAASEDAGKGVEVAPAAAAADEIFDCQALISQAWALKERAAVHVKKKENQRAVALYEQGIKLLLRSRGRRVEQEQQQVMKSLMAVLHANTAQCLLNQELYRRAIESCEYCLSLDPKNTKAAHRKSLAHEALKEWPEALRDAVALKRLGGGALGAEGIQARCEALLKKLMDRKASVDGKEKAEDPELKALMQQIDQEMDDELGQYGGAYKESAASNEDLSEMKRRFKAVLEKYDLGDGKAAPLVAEWLVEDGATAEATVRRVAERWGMSLEEAEHFASWIAKGLELKILPDPRAAANAPESASS